VSTYAYVNPLVAIVLGSLILNEKIDPLMLVGAAMIVVAVGVVVRTEAHRAPVKAVASTPAGAAEASPAASDELAKVRAD